MNNYWKVYWVTRLDYLQGLFVALAVVTALALLLYYAIEYFNDYASSERKDYRKHWAWLRVMLYILFVTGTVTACLIPTKEEAFIIMAGGSVMDYAQKDTSLQKLPYQGMQIIGKMLDQKLEELDKSKKKYDDQ